MDSAGPGRGGEFALAADALGFGGWDRRAESRNLPESQAGREFAASAPEAMATGKESPSRSGADSPDEGNGVSGGFDRGNTVPAPAVVPKADAAAGTEKSPGRPPMPNLSGLELPDLVYRLALFVRWPQQEGRRAFNVCLLGDDPGHVHWPAMLERRQVEGRGVVVRRVAFAPGGEQWNEGVRGCAVAVLGRTLAPQARGILTALEQQPVLTVGVFPGFASMGGMVELAFGEQQRQVRLNPLQAWRAGLRLEEGILAIAAVTRSGKVD